MPLPPPTLLSAIEQDDAAAIARLAEELSVENFNARGRASTSPLTHALSRREPHIAVVRALLSAGAYPGARRDEVKTPLTCAAQRASVEVIALLLANGADPNECDAFGAYPLLYLAQDHRACVPEAIRTLICAGADPNQGPHGRAKPLHLAIRGDCIEAGRALLEGGANPNAPDGEGDPPLVRAVRESPRMVSLLLHHHADPDRPGLTGRRALHAVVRHNHPELVRVLADAGARFDVRDGEGNTPRQDAEKVAGTRLEARPVLDALVAAERARALACTEHPTGRAPAALEGPEL